MNSLTWLALVTLNPSREPPVYDFFCCPISNRRDQSSSVSRPQRRFTKGDICVRTQERCGWLRCARGEPFQVGRCSLFEAGVGGEWWMCLRGFEQPVGGKRHVSSGVEEAGWGAGLWSV